MADRLADVEKRGEVHDRGHAVVLQRPADRRQVGDVALDDLAVPDRLAMSGDQAVERDNPVPRLVERLGRVAADIAGAAGDEDAPARHLLRLALRWVRQVSVRAPFSLNPHSSACHPPLLGFEATLRYRPMEKYVKPSERMCSGE